MEKHWSKTEIAHLKRHAASSTVEELAGRLNTDVATIRAKLAEHGLQAGSVAEDEDIAALELFTKGSRLLQEAQWAEAAKVFGGVADETDNATILDRTRQFLEVCRHRLEGEAVEADPYLQAVFEKNRGNLDGARELCGRGDVEQDERFAYLMASIQALTDAPEEAFEHLENAIRLEPKNRVHAYHDPDFESLRGQEKLTQLLAVGSAA